MKKTFILALGLLGCIPSFAGSILNVKTGERVELSANYETKVLNINSTDEGLGNKNVALNTVKQNESSQRLYPWTTDFCDNLGDGCYFLLVIPPFVPALAVIETPLLTFRLPMKLVQKKQNKDDFRLLQKAIVSDDSFDVSEKRFNRIVKILKNAR